MALDIDGFVLLRAIAQSPDVFCDISGDVARAGRALVVRQLKAKTLTLRGLREIHDSLGAETFGLVVDGLSDAEVRALVLRFDRHHPDDKVTQLGGLRRHLAGLASWTNPSPNPNQPNQPIGAAARPKRDGTDGISRALGHAAFLAVWDGKDHDPKPAKDKRRKAG